MIRVMASETSVFSPNSYLVACPGCRREVDAATSAWCNCIGKQTNVQCTCGTCLCKAGDSAVRAFWVNAPAAVRERRRAEQERRTREASAASQSSGEVLIVDDDEEIRLMAAFMVQQMGYTVSVAATPDEAMRLIDVAPPRVVITDALMPKMDGRELCRLIKLSDSSIKVAVMTSLYTAPRYKYEAFKRFRADEYMAKPIDFAALDALLQRLAPKNAAAVSR